jgi:hypothetical protein
MLHDGVLPLEHLRSHVLVVVVVVTSSEPLVGATPPPDRRMPPVQVPVLPIVSEGKEGRHRPERVGLGRRELLLDLFVGRRNDAESDVRYERVVGRHGGVEAMIVRELRNVLDLMCRHKIDEFGRHSLDTRTSFTTSGAGRVDVDAHRDASMIPCRCPSSYALPIRKMILAIRATDHATLPSQGGGIITRALFSHRNIFPRLEWQKKSECSVLLLLRWLVEERRRLPLLRRMENSTADSCP